MYVAYVVLNTFPVGPRTSEAFLAVLSVRPLARFDDLRLRPLSSFVPLAKLSRRSENGLVKMSRESFTNSTAAGNRT